VLAFLPWLNVRYAALSLVLALFALAQRPGWRRAGWLFLAPVVSAAALGAYHQILYGFLDPRRVYGRRPEFALGTLREGLPGLLLDQEFGLLVYAPVFALAPLGVAALWRRDRASRTGLGLVAVARDRGHVAHVAASTRRPLPGADRAGARPGPGRSLTADFRAGALLAGQAVLGAAAWSSPGCSTATATAPHPSFAPSPGPRVDALLPGRPPTRSGGGGGLGGGLGGDRVVWPGSLAAWPSLLGLLAAAGPPDSPGANRGRDQAAWWVAPLFVPGLRSVASASGR
jgi:hypothetical protein